MKAKPQAAVSAQAQIEDLLGTETRFREERRAYQPRPLPGPGRGSGHYPAAGRL